jgi:16S rRNA (cytidine1402-2'-O)-methyltransferase
MESHEAGFPPSVVLLNSNHRRRKEACNGCPGTLRVLRIGCAISYGPVPLDEQFDEPLNDQPDNLPDDQSEDQERPESRYEFRSLAPGLYLVGTPIGNMEDITLRALRVLKLADRIACEDTRQTQKLLNLFGLKTPTVSLHQHNERDRAVELVAELQAGKRIALVSDAGMPGISDPGGLLTQAAIAAGVPVYPVPGANAAVSALVASGLSTAEFHFLGFLPEKAGARRTQLESLAKTASLASPDGQPRTLIFYEAPHRILDTLSDLESVWGPALRVVVARELTKMHEEFLRGPVAEVKANLAARDRVRGEITLLVEAVPLSEAQEAAGHSLLTRLKELETSEGLSEKDALKRLARESGQGKSDLYRELQRERAKGQNPGKRPSKEH